MSFVLTHTTLARIHHSVYSTKKRRKIKINPFFLIYCGKYENVFLARFASPRGGTIVFLGHHVPLVDFFPQNPRNKWLQPWAHRRTEAHARHRPVEQVMLLGHHVPLVVFFPQILGITLEQVCGVRQALLLGRVASLPREIKPPAFSWCALRRAQLLAPGNDGLIFGSLLANRCTKSG